MAKPDDTFHAVVGNWRCMVLYLILCSYSMGTLPNPRVAMSLIGYGLLVVMVALLWLRIRAGSLLWRYLLLSAIALYISWDGILQV